MGHLDYQVIKLLTDARSPPFPFPFLKPFTTYQFPMPFQYCLRLGGADDVAESARRSARDQPQSGCQNSQGQFLCPVRLDWLVEFPLQDSQLMAQEEDFQAFFLFGQTADTHERYQC